MSGRFRSLFEANEAFDEFPGEASAAPEGVRAFPGLNQGLGRGYRSDTELSDRRATLTQRLSTAGYSRPTISPQA